MKKTFLAATLALLMIASTTFANGVTPPEKVVSGLHQDFSNVTDIQWKATANFYKASFIQDNKAFEAFYSFDGERIGLSRNLTIDQLPMNLIKEAKLKGGSSQVSELFELQTDRGTEYFITFKNDKGIKTYKSTGDLWSRYYVD